MNGVFARRMLLAAVVGLGWAGCASTAKEPPFVPTGNPAADSEEWIRRAPERDRVLRQYEAGMQALRRGDRETAKRWLDEALRSMEGILGGGDSNAKKSRGYFRAEAKKTFLGEPYERVMAYFYRGILYWIDGEPDNARACFRSAQLQDSDTAEKTYSGDYVLMDYLDGLVTAKLGGDGSDAFRRAEAETKAGHLPALEPKANALFFVEYGRGPVKYATGRYAEELRFRDGHSEIRSAELKLEGLSIPIVPWDDLLYQAITRGGRVMDHILANKAIFKSTTDAVGTASLIGGAIMASNHETETAGLALLLAGLVTKVVSAASTPAADVRMWANLPQFLGFCSVTVSTGEHHGTVEFRDGAGRVVGNLTKSVTIQMPPGGRDAVIFVSDRPAVNP